MKTYIELSSLMAQEQATANKLNNLYRRVNFQHDALFQRFGSWALNKTSESTTKLNYHLRRFCVMTTNIRELEKKLNIEDDGFFFAFSTRWKNR